MSSWSAIQHQPGERAFVARGGARGDDQRIELDLLVDEPDGTRRRVPAFWCGDGEWRVRFAPRVPGLHRWRSECTRRDDPGLHGVEGTLEAAPAAGGNPLLRHGPLRVAASRRHLEHLDGTPFLWLGDTWWFGFSDRLPFHGGFDVLCADRAAKGYSVIQIAAGFHPEATTFDPRGRNEAGLPWEDGGTRLNPAWYAAADRRIRLLVRSGLVPCVFGAWGFHLPVLGVERMKRHWRELIARWGAYPVVWTVAGEATTPFALVDGGAMDAAQLRVAWSEVAAHIRATDPYGHPLTVHPPGTSDGRTQLGDPALSDVEMLQGGHRGWRDLAAGARQVAEAVRTAGPWPVVMSEISYEGHLEGSRQEVQRANFWTAMLSGAAGFTYGANGLWQMNTEDVAFGANPAGVELGDIPWNQAISLPGAAHVAVGKRLIARLPWWRFQPRPDWVSDRDDSDGPLRPLAAGIPGELRLIYFPDVTPPWFAVAREIRGLEAGIAYRAVFLDPKDGREFPAGEVRGDAAGIWRVRFPALVQDWALLLTRAG